MQNSTKPKQSTIQKKIINIEKSCRRKSRIKTQHIGKIYKKCSNRQFKVTAKHKIYPEAQENRASRKSRGGWDTVRC